MVGWTTVEDDVQRRHADNLVGTGGDADAGLLERGDEVAADAILYVAHAGIAGDKPHRHFDPVVGEPVINPWSKVGAAHEVPPLELFQGLLPDLVDVDDVAADYFQDQLFGPVAVGIVRDGE